MDHVGNSCRGFVAGSDLLHGGPGFDTLAGGPGMDVCLEGESLTSCEETSLAIAKLGRFAQDSRFGVYLARPRVGSG